MIWLATVELMLSIIQIASFFHLTPPKLGGDVLSCFWVFHYQSLALVSKFKFFCQKNISAISHHKKKLCVNYTSQL